MIEKIFARQLENGLWQWRIRENSGWQNEGYFTGDNEALVGSLEGSREASVCLILAGDSCVSRLEVADVSNKRTLAKMLPYEMEDEIIDPIDNLHFALGEIRNSKIPVVYTKADKLEHAIKNLVEVGCDVAEISADYLLLQRGDDEIIVVWDEEKILAQFGEGRGFTAEVPIAQLYLQQLDIDIEKISRVTLVAESPEKCEELKSWLPEMWAEEEIEINALEGGFWDCLETEEPAADFNFRSGRFARQLPFVRWWHAWQKPAYFAAAAFVVAVGVNFAMYSEAKNRYAQILDERKEVFLQVVPNGRWQTPERELKSRLGNTENSSEPSDFIFLLQGVAKALETKNDIALASMRYSGDQKELVISFEAANFADVESLRTAIEAMGFSAETLRAAAQGDAFQARMKISQSASGATS